MSVEIDKLLKTFVSLENWEIHVSTYYLSVFINDTMKLDVSKKKERSLSFEYSVSRIHSIHNNLSKWQMHYPLTLTDDIHLH